MSGEFLAVTIKLLLSSLLIVDAFIQAQTHSIIIAVVITIHVDALSLSLSLWAIFLNISPSTYSYIYNTFMYIYSEFSSNFTWYDDDKRSRVKKERQQVELFVVEKKKKKMLVVYFFSRWSHFDCIWMRAGALVPAFSFGTARERRRWIIKCVYFTFYMACQIYGLIYCEVLILETLIWSFLMPIY